MMCRTATSGGCRMVRPLEDQVPVDQVLPDHSEPARVWPVRPVMVQMGGCAPGYQALAADLLAY